MNEQSRGRTFALALGLAMAMMTVVPSPASAGDEQLHEVTWGHPSPAQVSRFIVFVSPVRGDSALARQIEVGKPAGPSGGSLQIYSAIVPVDLEAFVAIGAVDDSGTLRSMSNWSAVPPSRPGQPVLVEP